jgi:inner membrane transporter RhtA
MTICAWELDPPAAAAKTATAARHDWLTGMALMTGSAASNQIGAATAALAFGVLGPAGVVAVRQWVAGAVLLTTVRPRFTTFTRRQWRSVLALALIFATMNLSLYVAIDRIGLGLAVTLEFLGPLSVALLASRRAVDLGCALVAGGAVVVLARPQPSTDYVGIFLALLAALCWAGYIVVNRVVGARLPGSQGPAAAAGVSALLYIPVGIWVLASHPVTAVALGRAAMAGVMCSAVPMVADLLALRRVPARFFGVFMSVNPVFAALTGLVVLGQSLESAEWLAIAAIVTANAVSVGTAGRANRFRPARAEAGSSAGLADGDIAAAAVDGDHVGGRRIVEGRRDVQVAALSVSRDVVPGVTAGQDHVDVAAGRADLQVLRRLGEHQGDVAATGLDVGVLGGNGVGVDVASPGEDREIAGEPVTIQVTTAGVHAHGADQVAGVDVAALGADLDGAVEPAGAQVTAAGVEQQGGAGQVADGQIAAAGRQRQVAGKAGNRDVATVAG